MSCAVLSPVFRILPTVTRTISHETEAQTRPPELEGSEITYWRNPHRQRYGCVKPSAGSCHSRHVLHDTQPESNLSPHITIRVSCYVGVRCSRHEHPALLWERALCCVLKGTYDICSTWMLWCELCHLVHTAPLQLTPLSLDYPCLPGMSWVYLLASRYHVLKCQNNGWPRVADSERCTGPVSNLLIKSWCCSSSPHGSGFLLGRQLASCSLYQASQQHRARDAYMRHDLFRAGTTTPRFKLLRSS